MKKITLIFTAISFNLASYAQSNTIKNVVDTIPESHYCISQSDAEKILGQPVKLIEKSSEKRGKIARHKCTYYLLNNIKPGVASNLYYLVEQYNDAASAKQAYTGIMLSNQSMPGLRKINKIGNETFIHTDGENFDLVMCRKSNKIIKIKINKITSTTSLDELENVARKIASTL